MNDGIEIEPLKVHLVRSDLALTDERPPTLKRYGASLRTFTLTENDPIQQILPLNSRRCSAWIQPSAADIYIATSESGAQAAGGGAALIPGLGHGDSVSATGVLQGTDSTGGDAIVTIPAASLPAARYQIDVYSQMTSLANGNHSNNVQLQAGDDAVVTLIEHLVAQNSGAYGPKQPLTVYRYLDGATALSANFIDNMAATETQDWTVTLVATPVAPSTSGPYPLSTTDPVWATAVDLPTTVTVCAVIEEAA